MKILYLDCFSGIAGDMFLAACIDSGLVEPAYLEKKLSGLGIGKIKVKVEKVERSAISATHLEFQTDEDSHDHRHWSEIREMIAGSKLAEGEKRSAIAIFQNLAEAEAKIHGSDPEQVHFHELGAFDSICDIVGAAIVLEKFNIDKAYASKINVGSGFVEIAHGRLPVPAPATLELLKEIPTYSSGIQFELVTPTGAAILKHLECEYAVPEARWEQIGYGAGTKDFPNQPNVLRLRVGESLSELQEDETILIETEIDDMNPEIFPYVQTKLLEKGIKSVSLQQLLMKKGRSGYLLRVLCDTKTLDLALEIIFRETTTLGVIWQPVRRKKLDRKIVEVETPYGKVNVKLGLIGDEIINLAPEHEDCRRLAESSGIALKEIYRVAMESASKLLKKKR
ncbi:nickel pincer cofactor biosynthesis protein LarC [Candidatus Acetothermia bacterium]|nr:nickel pincer cofactor biosynthesis protein LarC [Candidatus Acetothermia bacterium]